MASIEQTHMLGGYHRCEVCKHAVGEEEVYQTEEYEGPYGARRIVHKIYGHYDCLATVRDKSAQLCPECDSYHDPGDEEACIVFCRTCGYRGSYANGCRCWEF